jgi:hypothetical protein
VFGVILSSLLALTPCGACAKSSARTRSVVTTDEKPFFEENWAVAGVFIDCIAIKIIANIDFKRVLDINI